MNDFTERVADLNGAKVYVTVRADFDQQGNITPLSVKWEDGRIFEIDQILDVRRNASFKAGGTGLRYTIRIGSNKTQLFYENPSWFVERR